jgi:hypothetical protein
VYSPQKALVRVRVRVRVRDVDMGVMRTGMYPTESLGL